MAIQTALSKSFVSGEYSDLTLRCGESKFPVHRFIVCSRSPVIKRAVDGDFQEGKTGIIDVSADAATPGSVARLLRFIYHNCYDDTSTRDEYDQIQQRAAAQYDEHQQTFKYDEQQQAFKCAKDSFDPEDELGRPLHDTEDPMTSMTKAVNAVCKLVTNVHMISLGDYYQIPELVSFARDKFDLALTADALSGFAIVVEEV